MPESMPRLSVLIPAYNEGRHVETIVQQIREILPDREQTEIVVINDGSTDRKDWKDIEQLADQLLHHPRNKGYGAALKTGLRHCKGEWVAIIDADGTYDPKDIARIMEHTAQADMVVGARTGDVVKIPLVRQPARWLLTQLANYLADRRIPDLNSGLRIFRKDEAVEFLHLYPSGFSFTTTITLAFLCRDLRVVYVPINYQHRTGVSKIRPIRDTKNMFLTIVRTILFFEPLRIFFNLSLVFAALALAVLVGSFVALDGKVLDGTVSILAMTSVQMLVVGLLADLIVRKR
ncbi:MAG: glycosyltransferase family 2 protein [bacterium]